MPGFNSSVLSLDQNGTAAQHPPRCCTQPGSPHSKKLNLTPCPARTTKCRASTPRYSLWTKTAPPHSIPPAAALSQVHPIARSLSSHRALPAQLNAGLQPLSTPSGPKRHRRTASPRRCTQPGSPHSKKLILTPCPARTTKCRASTPQYSLWTKTVLQGAQGSTLRPRNRAKPAAFASVSGLGFIACGKTQLCEGARPSAVP
jgi:hypothetical protein